MNSRRIAFLLSQFPETHETFILREFIELKRLGFDFKIFSLKHCRDRIIHPAAKDLMEQTVYSPFLLSRALILDNIRVFLRRPHRIFSALFHITRRHWRTPALLVKTLAAVPKAIHYGCMMQREHFRHLHVHWANIPSTLGWLLCKTLDIPFSITAHAFDIFLNNPMLGDKIAGAQFVVTCTNYNRHFLQSLTADSDKIILNYHGIDLARLPDTLPQNRNNSEGNRLKLLSVGRLKEQKGFIYLIEACHHLMQNGLDFECLIVGEGPERARLEEMTSRYQLGKRVQLLGIRSQKEIFDLYGSSDIFVLPCVIGLDGDRDGVPNVLIEALAMRMPVVSSGVSGVPEIVHDGETGVLVRERNALDLCEKITMLANDKSYRIRLGEGGRRWVETRFDIRRNVQELGELFLGRVEQPNANPARPTGD